MVAAHAAVRAGLSWELSRFVGTVAADTLPTSALSLAFYAAPHFLGHTEALAAPSLVTRARVWSSQRLVTDRTR
jgi:hypothetical protein